MALAKAGFVLGIKPVSILRPHEETIPERVEGLAAEMRRDGVQKDPIIIDRDSSTVLDGMHRLAAFGSLRIENAVCCSVDYSSRAVTLGRWARVYKVAAGDSIPGFLGRRGITRRVSLAEAFDALENRDTGFAVITSDAAYVPDGRTELADAIDEIEGFDRQSKERRWERSFVPDDEIDVPLQSGKNVVLITRRLGKDDVVAAARSGNLFPCKTSMHRIDPRPVAVDFPIDRLGGATTATLAKELEGKSGRLLPSNSTYEGRTYKERLLLLDRD